MRGTAPCPARWSCRYPSSVAVSAQADSRAAASDSGRMFDQIKYKRPDQVYRPGVRPRTDNPFRAECRMPPICQTELSVRVHRSGPHEVADFFQILRFRLPPGGQSINNRLPETNGAVGPGQTEVPGGKASCFLLRRVLPQPFDLRRCREAVMKRERRVPGFGNHPVRPQFVGQVVGECDQRVGMPAAPGEYTACPTRSFPISKQRRSKRHPSPETVSGVRA